jgi:hypothetical protein
VAQWWHVVGPRQPVGAGPLERLGAVGAGPACSGRTLNTLPALRLGGRPRGRPCHAPPTCGALAQAAVVVAVADAVAVLGARLVAARHGPEGVPGLRVVLLAPVALGYAARPGGQLGGPGIRGSGGDGAGAVEVVCHRFSGVRLLSAPAVGGRRLAGLRGCSAFRTGVAGGTTSRLNFAMPSRLRGPHTFDMPAPSRRERRAAASMARKQPTTAMHATPNRRKTRHRPVHAARAARQPRAINQLWKKAINPACRVRRAPRPRCSAAVLFGGLRGGPPRATRADGRCWTTMHPLARIEGLKRRLRRRRVCRTWDAGPGGVASSAGCRCGRRRTAISPPPSLARPA